MGGVYRRNIGAVALTALQDGHARWAPGDILRPAGAGLSSARSGVSSVSASRDEWG